MTDEYNKTNFNRNEIEQTTYNHSEPTQINEKHRKCGLRVWYLPQVAECNPYNYDIIVCTICEERIRKVNF